MSIFLWSSALYVFSWNASRCMSPFLGLDVDDEYRMMVMSMIMMCVGDDDDDDDEGVDDDDGDHGVDGGDG